MIQLRFSSKPPNRNVQNPRAFRKGNATSRAPICSGITAFIRAKMTGITPRKIIVVPCIVINSLNCCAVTKLFIGFASCTRISNASMPPIPKKKPPATKYKMAIFL
ncbi:hypothetical protein D3C81_1583760 [compost metagenome]